ncbi:phosphotransferase [Nocardioides sp.]|uniref:phosphotransferase n=1 Tax=Nocardioides sp. TaxID=35761 RepID=UPI002B26D453|nr:phosphotransferase [Nocardioides sp.]
MPPPTLPPAPVGRTARRLEWAHLPPALRDLIADRCGSLVVSAVSQRSGFTPGFASVLLCEDGTRHFVKAASLKAQRVFAEAYREEARKAGALPPGIAATRLLWTHDADGWVVLGFEHVTARAPHRPWTHADLTRCLDALAETARALTPPPPGLDLVDAEVEFADWPAKWDHTLATFALPSGVEAAALATRHAEVVGGDTVLHCDVRDDNLLLTDDGRVLLCDWNWPLRGAAWLDSLILLVGPRGDGLDVEEVLATHPTFAEVEPEAVDIMLALLTGYFLTHSDQPVPSSSPYLRDHQLWQGEACWEWLCERRGWAESP